jgi:geranylgeranyl reductase family protein
MNPGATCDVAVVGGGPAGATAAYLLAGNGFRVQLFDKCPFPRPKLCAGLLTWKTIDLLAQLFATGADELVRNGLVRHTCHDYRIYYHRTEIVRGRLDFPFHFVDRTIYDHHWFKMAQAAGAYVETGNSIVSADCGRGELMLQDGRIIRAKIIIGADGVWSRVRRALTAENGSKRKWRRLLAATVEAHQSMVSSTPGPPFASLHFGQVGWGYAWSFPEPAGRNLGVAYLAQKDGRSLRRVFDRCLAEMDIDTGTLTPWRSHPLPYGNYLRRPAHQRALLVGDACGLADPLLGEGIYYAHRSAQIAVQAIIDANGRWDNIAPLYCSSLRRHVIRELRWTRLLRGLLFIGGRRRRYRGLKMAFRVIPKRIEAAIQGTRPFSRLLLPWA